MSEAFDLPLEFASELTKLVASDSSGRSVARLCRPQLWQRAVKEFAGMSKVAVASGFFVPETKSPETDGPGGAVMLARAYLEQGADAVVWTDKTCLDVLKACAASVGFPDERVLVPNLMHGVEDFRPDGVIFTERLGRAANGYYYNMRKKNISIWTWPLDNLAIDCLFTKVPLIGIGDGGNEVGMGNFMVELGELLPDFRPCLSVVRATIALPVDVSNWGAYALAAALSLVWGVWRGPRPGEEKKMLEALCASGAVDGIKLASVPSVDGFGLERHEELISSLSELWRRFMDKREPLSRS